MVQHSNENNFIIITMTSGVGLFIIGYLFTKSLCEYMNNLNFHDISCWVCHRGNEHPDHPPEKK